MVKQHSLRSHLIIALGLLCNAFGWAGFLIPSEVSGGGVSGVSALLYFASGIPAGITYLVINIVLLFIGSKVLGRVFTEKSIYGVLLFSAFLTLSGTDS